MQKQQWILKLRKSQFLDKMGNNAKLSPEDLIKLQDKILNYNIEVSLVSTIARKTVGAVETLLRS